MRRTCPKCGAVYELADYETFLRDKDSLKCNFCNKIIMKWNGTTFWVIKKVIKEPNKLE